MKYLSVIQTEEFLSFITIYIIQLITKCLHPITKDYSMYPHFLSIVAEPSYNVDEWSFNDVERMFRADE